MFHAADVVETAAVARMTPLEVGSSPMMLLWGIWEIVVVPVVMRVDRVDVVSIPVRTLSISATVAVMVVVLSARRKATVVGWLDRTSAMVPTSCALIVNLIGVLRAVGVPVLRIPMVEVVAAWTQSNITTDWDVVSWISTFLGVVAEYWRRRDDVAASLNSTLGRLQSPPLYPPRHSLQESPVQYPLSESEKH